MALELYVLDYERLSCDKVTTADSDTKASLCACCKLPANTPGKCFVTRLRSLITPTEIATLPGNSACISMLKQ